MSTKYTVRNDGPHPRGLITANGNVVQLAPGDEKPVELHDGTYRNILKGEGSPFVIVDGDGDDRVAPPPVATVNDEGPSVASGDDESPQTDESDGDDTAPARTTRRNRR